MSTGTGRPDRILVVGCHGGVGRAVLALLQHSEPGRHLREGAEEILLLDAGPPVAPVELDAATLLPPATIGSGEDLAALVREHRITKVIDLSSVDTVDCTRACDTLGTHFLCTSVEEWPGRGSIPTDEAIARLLPPRRPALGNAAHLVGSGANPGLVNALVFAALDAFAERAGVDPTPEALDLHSVLITEEDTTVDGSDPGDPDVFPMTWSPFHCLEELYEPRAFAAEHGSVIGLGHRPTERWYRARCGDHIIDGMAVPHEETVTLATRMPGIEIGFIYRIPPAARAALAAHPERDVADAWKTRRLCPPWTTDISGQDRVGVLLCSRRFGELWMGFETDVELGLRYGTNATQLQVAAGVLAGWAQLGTRTGIHFVEDLDCNAVLEVAGAVLGAPVVVYDPDAPPQMLTDRVVTPVGSASLSDAP